MRAGFIGAGKAGCSIAKLLKESPGDWEIVGFASRSISSALEAAEFLGCAAYPGIAELADVCGAIFITTPDGEIARVWQGLRGCGICLGGKIFIHCSGSLSSDIFDGADELGATAASLHPLYAISDRFRSYLTLGNALFTLEGRGGRMAELRGLLEDSGLDVQGIDARSKTAYHAAASVASNLMVGLAELAVQLLLECGFDRATARRALRPLMQGNLDSIMERDTAAALTGPAERADVSTVAGHLGVLSGDDREIYRLLTRKIVGLAKQKNPDRDYSELERLLKCR